MPRVTSPPLLMFDVLIESTPNIHQPVSIDARIDACTSGTAGKVQDSDLPNSDGVEAELVNVFECRG